ncbi:MAG: lantibiotic dehydratase [Acidobacteriota bacterium]|nr:lantibiotic dehydratase [Acidobacteriota bacterium]
MDRSHSQLVADAEDADTGTFPPHLEPLPGERWGLWRWFCLRGAGFPAREVLRLASPSVAEAADRVLAAEGHLEACREAALEELRDGLEELEKRERFRRIGAISRLNKGKTPRKRDVTGPATNAAIDSAVERFAEARDRLEAETAAFGQSFDDGMVELAGHLREIASDDRFRQALSWQNRHALETGVDALLRQPADGSRNSQERQHEQVVTAYLQRYCTKNDTIGWFGPMGWGQFTATGDDLVFEAGEDLVAERIVRFENWCVDKVAEVLLGGEELRPYWLPRVMPFFVLRGRQYIPMQGEAVELSEQQLAVFQACDGRRSARQIAQDLAADPQLGFEGPEAVMALLTAMHSTGMLLWQPELPMVRRPERVLRQRLEAIDDPELREPRLARLDELEAHRDRIAAAGDADQLGEALEALEEWFTEVTGSSATRLGGKTYAARTLIHQDCRRDIRLELGPAVLDELGPPLSLILMSARWFTYELSRRWTEQLTEAYRQLREASGQAVIPLFQYFHGIQPILLQANIDMVAEVAAEMQQRWAKILDLEGDERRVERSSAEVRRRLEEALPAPGPGWKHAREQCPDVLLRAESPEAIRRGEFGFVLGEIHLSTNTLRTRLFSESHPDPAVLLDAVLRDIPEPTVVPWLPRRRSDDETTLLTGVQQLSTTTARLDYGLVTGKDLRISLDLEPPADPEAPTVRIGDFVVLEDEGQLHIRSLDGSYDFQVMDFLDAAFSAQTINSFRVMPKAPHVPRVTIDRMVVQRESWRIPAAELDFPGAKTEPERFLGARRWARSHGIPRFVFARSPYENKPFFVDFDSPPAVEIFCRIARRAIDRGGEEIRLGVSEMLPDFDDCWLQDAEGNHYTSELRVVAVDLAEGGANAEHPGLRVGGEES